MSGAERTPRRVLPAAVLPVAVAAVPLLAFAFGSLIGWGARAAGGWLAVWASVLAAATASASLLSAAVREPDKQRRDSWYWFAAGAAAWSAGVAVHAVSRLVSTSSVVALSFADLFFLTALFGLAGGLVTPIQPPRSLGAWLRFAADTYICATALVVVVWIVGLGPLYRLSGETPADFLVEFAFPLLEAIMACALLAYVAGTAAVQRRSALLAYVALVTLAVAGTINVASPLLGADGHTLAGVGEFVELSGLLLLGIAPWVDRPAPGRTAGETAPESVEGAVEPGAAHAAESSESSDSLDAEGAEAVPDDSVGEARGASELRVPAARKPADAAVDDYADAALEVRLVASSPLETQPDAAPLQDRLDPATALDSQLDGAMVPPAGPVDGPRPAEAVTPGRLVTIGPVSTAMAAMAAVLVAGYALTSPRQVDPVVPLLAGSAVLAVLARLALLIRESRRLRAAVDTGEARFRALAETVSDAVYICDLDGTVRYVGAGAAKICALPSGELPGRRVHEVVHPEDLPRITRGLDEFVEDEASRDHVLQLACRVRAADGTWLPIEATVSRFVRSGKPDRMLITTRDFSEQAALRRQVDHLTFTDRLTGLPNRAYFEERTREVLARQGGGGHVAVVFVDLDGFTAVNDSTGHASGDQVLAQAARRLRAAVPADDTVARWGGDEFAVLVDSASEPQDLVDLAERLLRTLSADPYQLAGRGVVLTASLGIAVAGVDADANAGIRGMASATTGGKTDTETGVKTGAETGVKTGVKTGAETDRMAHAEAAIGRAAEPGADRGAGTGANTAAKRSTSWAELIRNADVALSRAKERGGGRVEVFAARMHADVVRRLELGSDLQRALAEGNFAVEFQPVVELATSRVTGVEALVRWRRGDKLVPPEHFIRPAEEFGLMVSLGEWILREACGQVARWRRSSWDIGLSINLSPRQIAAPRFVESVASALEESGLPPEALTLEVTEEMVVHDEGETVDRLCALRDLGVRLAIDDFGTGYASLAYLGQLPVDVIKIAPSFVAGLRDDETRTLLTRTIVRLGRDLGVIVVAEGIERPEQLTLLREMGCPRGQGYLVARPMAPDGIEALVRTDPHGTVAVSLGESPSAAPAH